MKRMASPAMATSAWSELAVDLIDAMVGELLLGRVAASMTMQCSDGRPTTWRCESQGVRAAAALARTCRAMATRIRRVPCVVGLMDISQVLRDGHRGLSNNAAGLVNGTFSATVRVHADGLVSMDIVASERRQRPKSDPGHWLLRTTRGQMVCIVVGWNFNVVSVCGDDSCPQRARMSLARTLRPPNDDAFRWTSARQTMTRDLMRRLTIGLVPPERVPVAASAPVPAASLQHEACDHDVAVAGADTQLVRGGQHPGDDQDAADAAQL